ncbi:carbohydrate ABC transporter permease [Arthrobacter sp. W4I7]|uniref:carbohydrate ABC transporter permease n=1 Tax=Arthrobacter sp. W4I7 TaxID=3042296 RepID=UPI0027806B82|nr:carbohydrate ABC transporter permease [Arthrobacter sp. W4I7]MDQ0693136.1 multiple sugar transport system permease protein [Arthrobacter sp. W4I7]
MLSLLAVTILYPVLWMFSTSLRDNGSVLMHPFDFSGTWGFDNYTKLFWEGDILTWLGSSIFVNITSVALIAVLSVLAGYGFSAYTFPGKNILFVLLIIGLTIPPQALVVAGFRWITLWGVENTYWSLIFTYGGWTSFGILMMRNFFDSVPKELREAAIMDGASQFRIFRQVYLPLAASPMTTVLIFTAVWVWNDFIYPIVYLQSEEMYTIPIGVLQFTGRTTVQLATQMAVLTFATALPLAMYLIFRKQFMRGLLEGAVKG